MILAGCRSESEKLMGRQRRRLRRAHRIAETENRAAQLLNHDALREVNAFEREAQRAGMPLTEPNLGGKEQRTPAGRLLDQHRETLAAQGEHLGNVEGALGTIQTVAGTAAAGTTPPATAPQTAKEKAIKADQQGAARDRERAELKGLRGSAGFQPASSPSWLDKQWKRFEFLVKNWWIVALGIGCLIGGWFLIRTHPIGIAIASGFQILTAPIAAVLAWIAGLMGRRLNAVVEAEKQKAIAERTTAGVIRSVDDVLEDIPEDNQDRVRRILKRSQKTSGVRAEVRRIKQENGHDRA